MGRLREADAKCKHDSNERTERKGYENIERENQKTNQEEAQI
jgi:hypothetical protein